MTSRSPERIPARARRLASELATVTLETSLKPFDAFDDASLRAGVEEMFTQWSTLLATAAECSLLLWISDGSEILDWAGDLDAPVVWADTIGFNNVDAEPYGEHKEPERVAVRYRDDPPALGYDRIRSLVRIIRETGERRGIPTRVGATFDPGPEFAASAFKFRRHPEILARGADVGIGPIIEMVRHFSVLDADDHRYAAYPDGIPAGTRFGEFLGRQAEDYLAAMGFDYLWLSNGFGFSGYAWSELGESFDGAEFHTDRTAGLRARALEFWDDLRRELSVPIEVRGTNQSAGIDIGADSVPALEIYERGHIAGPPPNSPWGPLNEDFGIEICGYLSRIAMLPRGSEGYRFRFYANDPWFWQQPWWDFYHRETFDIHLPLSVARVTGDGMIQPPREVNILSIDTAHGVLDERCAREVGTAIAIDLETRPDAAGPLVWVYPFREYHEAMAADPETIARPYAEDWYLSAAITAGLPLNTVVSTDEVAGAQRSGALASSILIVPAGALTAHVVAALHAHRDGGGDVVVYGSLRGVSEEALGLLGLDRADAGDAAAVVEGDLALVTDLVGDRLPGGRRGMLRHNALLSDGPIELVHPVDGVRLLARVRMPAGTEAPYATVHGGDEGTGAPGAAIWVRGSAPFDYSGADERGVRHRVLVDRARFDDSAALLRDAVATLGVSVAHELRSADAARAVLGIRRHAGAHWLSGYVPDTTLRLRLSLADGAPLLTHAEAWYEDGVATYQLTKSVHAECRVFVTQEASGMMRCREIAPFPADRTRGLRVEGLTNARVIIALPPGSAAGARVETPLSPDAFVLRVDGTDRIEIRQVSGHLSVAWQE